jgi:apolipoprotein N-acyltransferase
VEPRAFVPVLAASALLWAAAGAVSVALARALGWSPIALFPLAVVAIEALASQRAVMGGAAFVASFGYVLRDTSFVGVAAWSGVSGVGLLLLAANAAWVGARLRPDGRRVGVAIAVFVAAIVLAAVPAPGPVQVPVPDLRVGIVQGVLPRVDTQMAFFDPNVSARLLSHYAVETQRLAERGVDVVIWGETVVPYDLVDGRIDASVLAALSPAPPVLAGAREREGRHTYNAVLHADGSAISSAYRKRVLVPVIEETFTAGVDGGPVHVGDHRIGLTICLESHHPDLFRTATLAGADVHVLLSDDTFAGRTASTLLHTATAAYRAAETGRALVFVGESGPSAVFGPRGESLLRTPAWRAETVVGTVPIMRGMTPYARFGDWVARLAGSALVALVWLSTRRRGSDAA